MSSGEKSDSELSDSDPRKKNLHPRGQPRKKSKLNDISFSQVERFFDSVEKKLKASVSDLMAEAVAPL